MFGFKIITQHEKGIVFLSGGRCPARGGGADLGQPIHLPAAEVNMQSVVAAVPGRLAARLLQTVVEVAAEKNSTPRRTAPWPCPVPVELLCFFDRSPAPQPGRRHPGHRRLAAARARNTRPHAGEPAS